MVLDNINLKYRITYLMINIRYRVIHMVYCTITSLLRYNLLIHIVFLTYRIISYDMYRALYNIDNYGYSTIPIIFSFLPMLETESYSRPYKITRSSCKFPQSVL